MRAKGISWEPVKVDLFKTEQYDPKYLKLNPKGVVPTLVHNGKPVIESTLICEYTDETFKQPPYLIPVEPWRQSRMRLWSKMVDEGLHDVRPASSGVPTAPCSRWRTKYWLAHTAECIAVPHGRPTLLSAKRRKQSPSGVAREFWR